MPLSDSGELFNRAKRRCEKCGKTVEVPAKIVWGDSKIVEYCECGGELRRL